MPLLSEIDALRGEARRLSDLSREWQARCGEVQYPSDYWDLRFTLEAVEKKIEEKLVEYIALPRCPWEGCSGRMMSIPIKHVLQCTKCEAILLPGRMVPYVHVEVEEHGEPKMGGPFK